MVKLAALHIILVKVTEPNDDIEWGLTLYVCIANHSPVSWFLNYITLITLLSKEQKC